MTPKKEGERSLPPNTHTSPHYIIPQNLKKIKLFISKNFWNLLDLFGV